MMLYLLFQGFNGYGVNYRDGKDSLNRVTNPETTRTKELLKSMNQVSGPQFTDSCTQKRGRKLRVLILGNSLTRHGIAANIGWNHVSGMAATSEDKDFAHLLFKKIEARLPDRNICLRISNLADFERKPSSFQFSKLDDLVNYKPDILIFQIGENVSFNEQITPQLFQEKYVELVNCFKKNRHSLILCTTPFFPSQIKNEVVRNVALGTGSFLVDLSNLPLTNSQNYAKDEVGYTGDKTVWKVEGIGIHPGDLGMRNIADLLFIPINAELSHSR